MEATKFRFWSSQGGTGEEKMHNKQTKNKETLPIPITPCAPRKTDVQSPLDPQKYN